LKKEELSMHIVKEMKHREKTAFILIK
jgi:hypothetical protein